VHARTIKKAQGKSKALVEPYITIDGSIYTDMAKAFKQAGLIKTARLNNNLRKAIKDISDSFVQAMSKDTKPQKLTYKQAQVRVTNKLKRHNLPSVAKNSKAMFTILRVLKSYGMIRGDIPEDPIADTPVNEVKTRKQLREWRKLAHLFKK